MAWARWIRRSASRGSRKRCATRLFAAVLTAAGVQTVLLPDPLPTPVLYTGVLQVLAPEHDAPRGVWWNRSRQIANMAREHNVEDYPPLAAALRRVY